MSPQRLALAAVMLAVLVLVVVGLTELGGSSSQSASRMTLPEMRAQLASSPPRLAALHAQAAELLSGGLPALRARLGSLRGTPIVVNKWASWCVPCRSEFAAFQRVSVARGRQVAFIGIDSGDSAGAARSFLRSFPVSYPSYSDPGGQAGLAITDSSFTPVTVFFNAAGSEFIHQGPYLQASKLERAVQRYALN